MSQSDIVGELLLATENLADLVEQETTCLRNGGLLEELHMLHGEKLRLTAAYEAQLTGFRAERSGSALDTVTREALVQAGRRLRQATAINGRAIETARSITTALLGTVTRAAATERRAQGYAPPSMAPKKRNATLSLTLDQRF